MLDHVYMTSDVSSIHKFDLTAIAIYKRMIALDSERLINGHFILLHHKFDNSYCRQSGAQMTVRSSKSTLCFSGSPWSQTIIQWSHAHCTLPTSPMITSWSGLFPILQWRTSRGRYVALFLPGPSTSWQSHCAANWNYPQGVKNF